MTNKPVIKPRRTPAQQAQRDEFLRAVIINRSWLNNIIRAAEQDDWHEVEFLIEGAKQDYIEMKKLLPTDRAEPRGD
ncbi:hypothetical protein E0G79_23380 [Salmonella enterica]|nr:hypothetical protein [Salmonella enterica]EBZ4590192.1 hypothetical protein [Salmonella enterica subsp. enterica serovar Hato]EDR5775237.1 hypothetical protein [Salmonella enterica subsp. enterica serovar Kokomlemle]